MMASGPASSHDGRLVKHVRDERQRVGDGEGIGAPHFAGQEAGGHVWEKPRLRLCKSAWKRCLKRSDSLRANFWEMAAAPGAVSS
mmetsp:Transcript_5716/g.16031  ORF Transcript_5716/g.16031 Transcript_5716/m.16031 type:complete len:85 (+) Transcript_5716:72-326(+)